MAATHKFASLSTEEVEQKQRNLQNKTKSKERTAVEQFKAYLEWMGEKDTDFFKFSKEKLDSFLATFWFNVRNQQGELYKVKTLEGIRYSLNHTLKDNGSKFDITNKASTFQMSIHAFEDAKKELKQEGKEWLCTALKSHQKIFFLQFLSRSKASSHKNPWKKC